MYAVFATIQDDDGYVSARSEEEEDFYECVTEEASPIHVLNASQSLVVSRDGLSTSIRLADAASLGGPVPLDLGGAKLAICVVAEGPTRVATVVPRVVVANALGCSLLLHGLTIPSNGMESFHGTLTSLTVGSSTTGDLRFCLLYTSPSPRDSDSSRMPSSA